MFFRNKKKLDQLAEQLEQGQEFSYWAIVRKQFYKNRLAVFALRIFYVIVGIALLADFLANERPIYCTIKMEHLDELQTTVDTLVKLDTLLLVQGNQPPKKMERSTKNEERAGQLPDLKLTRTQITTKISFAGLAKDPLLDTALLEGQSTYRMLQWDTIITTTTHMQVDSVVETYYPVFRQYLVDLGLATWDERFISTKWLEQKYESVIFAPIRYSSNTRDARNNKFKSPLGDQKFEEGSNYGWHYLGTERIGLDVAAGMIHGTRTAMLVGLVAMSIATLIGFFFGAISGYFGDERLKVSRGRIGLNVVAFVIALFYAFVINAYTISDLVAEGALLSLILFIILTFGAFLAVANILAIPFKYIPYFKEKVAVPVDLAVMRFIEVVNSIPLLILILAIVAIVEKPSVLFVMVIIGVVSWTGIAKFLRAELLRVRSLEYIEAAQAFGYNELRIILRHALPNALAPVLIAIAFGVATAILTEAFLSFIGIGIPDDQVTWGSLLQLSRDKFSAWWLAIFPGFAIFITVTVFNLIGEGLTDALDPRLRA